MYMYIYYNIYIYISIFDCLYMLILYKYIYIYIQVGVRLASLRLSQLGPFCVDRGPYHVHTFKYKNNKTKIYICTLWDGRRVRDESNSLRDIIFA